MDIIFDVIGGGTSGVIADGQARRAGTYPATARQTKPSAGNARTL